MLELKNITKIYKTNDYEQIALDKINICFRKNEFVSILGPSGSGKTTLLNIIGGLDHADYGELVINERSTKKYKDRDWDSYRNHRIGFIFQNYNLITHQTILANVELALTLSGVSKKERKKKAKLALKAVGLEHHINKKPNQLSGGQMQRVAIARALVNNPDILLADEPTGALDSKTSIQIMDIIKEISKDKLVIMVTHNPDLASDYSTRIIELKDGNVINDTNPYDGEENTTETKRVHKHNTGKTSMNFITALFLSLNNLMTKKGRTILTAFAGSIGIIGIALILSLSNGVNNYINNIQKETMLSYPIEIEQESLDFSSIMKNSNPKDKKINHKKDAIYSDNTSIDDSYILSSYTNKNNLTEFKKYLDNKNNKINNFIGENGIIYSYDTKYSIYTNDSDGKLINTDGSTFENKNNNPYIPEVVTNTVNTIFSELMPSNKENNTISTSITNEYDLIYGNWPKEYNELVLVLDQNNEIPIDTIYNLGLLPAKEYKEILNKVSNKEKIKVDTKKLSYEIITQKSLKLLIESDFYIKNKNGLYEYIKDNDGKVEELVKNNSTELKIVGILKQKKDSKNETIKTTIGYTKKLTDYIIKKTNDSNVVKEQENNNNKNIITGLKFKISTNDEKADETKTYLSNLSISEKAKLSTTILKQAYKNNEELNSRLMNSSEAELANSLDIYLQNPDKETLISIYDNYISNGSFEENMKLFGKIDINNPSSIRIYADSFENKDSITKEITKYNDSKEKEYKITYTDYVGLLMSSVTTIINAISYVLIAFVSISLIVSSIMISIITYISVLERTKEIGVLRAIGASKKDVTRVFNAETFIEGLIAGLIGIIVTIILNIPINIIIYNLVDIKNISKLPILGAIILIIISVILTLIAGLIPSRLASKKDPVESLRSE